MSEELKIIVVCDKEYNSYVAYAESDNGFCGHGRSASEAIGRMVRQGQDRFGVKLEYRHNRKDTQ